MSYLSRSHTRAQAMLEYILVMVVVVVMVLWALKGGNNGALERLSGQTNQYFNAGSTAIMGGYYDGTTMVRVEPQAVNGGWCAWTTCVNGYKTRECACPRPAFGGAACTNGISYQGC